MTHTRYSWRQRVLFGCAAVGLSVLVAMGLLLATDVWLHHRFAPTLGYNVWGYRGSTAGRKRAGEYRVVMLGGSVMYGYGVAPTATIPVFLERDLRAATGSDKFTVVNLAYNSEGAYSFRFTLRDYAYLDYDLAILFEGYNDLSRGGRNTSVFRHESPLFRATGYLPILPLVFREKAAAMLHGGDIGAAYRDSDKTVFRPTWTMRAGAEALKATATIETSLERQFDRVSRDGANAKPAPPGVDHEDCGDWAPYCQSIAEAVDIVRARGKQVLVATQPYAGTFMRPTHIDQQQKMAAMLQRRYASDRNVGYANLGDVIDVTDGRLTGDGMHPTEEGNVRLAAAFVPPVLEMAKAVGR